LGYCRELSNHLADDEKAWANVTTPQNPLLPLRFKVYGFDFVFGCGAVALCFKLNGKARQNIAGPYNVV